MKNFIFPFESLLNYRRSKCDLCRQLLAQVLASDHRLLADRKSLEQQRHKQLQELRELVAAGEVDVDRSASRRYFAGQVLGDIRLVDRNRQIVAEQLDLCRQALSKADRDVKVLEKLQAKQQAEFYYENRRRENRELAELWMATRYSDVSK